MNRMVSAPVTLIVCVYVGGSKTPFAANLSILPAMLALLSVLMALLQFQGLVGDHASLAQQIDVGALAPPWWCAALATCAGSVLEHGDGTDRRAGATTPFQG